MIPTADTMAGAIKSFGRTLLINELIDASVYSNLEAAISRLNGKKKTWRYSVEASRPLSLAPLEHAQLNKWIFPEIYVDIEVDETKITQGMPPFEKLVATFELKEFDTGKIKVKSHIDLANKNEATLKYQEGPLFHLQFGGHSPGNLRDEENKLKEPRWTHPPMDLILLCETVIANFYPDKWAKIKTQPAWQQLIHTSQILCYQYYFEKINDCLSKGKPILNHIWASEWGNATGSKS